MKYLFIGGPRDGERFEIEGAAPYRIGEYRLIAQLVLGDKAYGHTAMSYMELIAQLIERYPEPEKPDAYKVTGPSPLDSIGTEEELAGDLDAIGNLVERYSGPESLQDKMVECHKKLQAFREARKQAMESCLSTGPYAPPDNLFTASCGCVLDVNGSSVRCENIVSPCDYFGSLRPFDGSRAVWDHYDVVSAEWRASQKSAATQLVDMLRESGATHYIENASLGADVVERLEVDTSSSQVTVTPPAGMDGSPITFRCVPSSEGVNKPLEVTEIRVDEATDEAGEPTFRREADENGIQWIAMSKPLSPWEREIQQAVNKRSQEHREEVEAIAAKYDLPQLMDVVAFEDETVADSAEPKPDGTFGGVPIVWKQGLGPDDVEVLPPIASTKESGKDSEVEFNIRDEIVCDFSICPDCNGTGQIVLFNTVEPCKTCQPAN